MKVAIISGTYPPIGGAGARLIRMFEPISKNHDIHFFIIGSLINENEDYIDGNYSIHKVKLPPRMPTAKFLFSSLTKNNLFERMKKFGVFDAIFSYYMTPWASLALSASKRFTIPLFSDYPDLEIYENNVIYRIVTVNILKKVFKTARYVFPISNPLKDRLINFYKIPGEKITVIPNGVNTEIFTPTIDGTKIKEKLGLSDHIIIGHMGSLKEWIRLDMLFETFKNLKKDYDDIKLVIVGGQETEIGKWKKLSKKLEIGDNIVFTGLVPYKEIPRYIASFDIAVSIFSKSLFTDVVSPLKVIEYMSMGKAVVADDLSGTREFIKNNENGILFVPEDTKSLENAVRTILDDEYLKRKLEINARRTALNYDWKTLSKKMADIMIDKIGMVE